MGVVEASTAIASTLHHGYNSICFSVNARDSFDRQCTMKDVEGCLSLVRRADALPDCIEVVETGLATSVTGGWLRT